MDGFVFARFQDRYGPLPCRLADDGFLLAVQDSSFYFDRRSWATTALALASPAPTSRKVDFTRSRYR
jgi:hypothetical protein